MISQNNPGKWGPPFGPEKQFASVFFHLLTQGAVLLNVINNLPRFRFPSLGPAARTSREPTCTSAASPRRCARANWRLCLLRTAGSSRRASSAIRLLVSSTWFQSKRKILIFPIPSPNEAGLSKGVGFIRFDTRGEAERAIDKLNGTVPQGATEPITVKFANNPSNSTKGLAPLAAYLPEFSSGAAAAAAAALGVRRFGGPIHPTGRLRYIPLSPLAR